MALALSVLLASTQPLATASAAEGVAVGHAARSALRGVGDPYFPSYGNRGYDVTHYAITDAIDPRTGRLSGRTALTAEAVGDRRRIALDLVLTPLSVRVDGERATFHQERGRKLVITPEGGLGDGDTFRVVVRYRGKPEQIVRGDLAPWISGSGEAVAMGEPEICAWWFACNDHPRDKATYDISVRVPQGRQAISNGVLVSRSSTAGHTVWHWRMSDPMASYLAFLAAGRFQVQQTTADGLPVVYAVSKRLSTRERQVGLRLLQRTPRITRWLSDQFGD